MLQRLTAGSQRYFQDTTPNRLSRHTVMGPWFTQAWKAAPPIKLSSRPPSLGPAVKREDVQPRRPRTFVPAPAHAVRTGVQSAQIIILSSAPRPRASYGTGAPQAAPPCPDLWWARCRPQDAQARPPGPAGAHAGARSICGASDDARGARRHCPDRAREWPRGCRCCGMEERRST